MVADLGPEGVGAARPFADVKAHFPDAWPDGPVVDAEGHVWTGLYNGWPLARFSPDGALVLTVRLPTQNLTKPCLGGPERTERRRAGKECGRTWKCGGTSVQ